jgi:CRISPR-associated exonuclease Cas4
MTEDDYIAIAALQHYSYCPRQCAFIHVEQAWAENFFTAQGNILHQKVNTGLTEKRGKTKTERNVALISHQYKIHGFADVVEITNKTEFIPIEYKKGKPKIADHDRIQLMAQALCLEEMRNIHIPKAALWYFETRHREVVELNDALRNLTIDIIQKTSNMIQSGITPSPIYEAKKCNSCSLKDLCQPKIFQKDKSKSYLTSIFSMDNTE